MSVTEVLRSLWANPVGLLVCRWNWKSALLSSLFRGLIFFFTNLSAGLHAAMGALVAEWCYRAVTAGFYGAITQSLSEAEPPWAAAVAGLIILPLISHAVELTVHLLRHTPKLTSSLMGSVCFTVLSTLFHLYAMRRGAFVVQRGGSSLGEDMRRVPRLLLAFLAAGPVALFRLLLNSSRFSPPPSRNERFTGL